MTFIGHHIPGPVRILPAPTPAQRSAIDAAVKANPFRKIHAPGTTAHGTRDLGALSELIRRDEEKARQLCDEAGEHEGDWFPSRGHVWTQQLGR